MLEAYYIAALRKQDKINIKRTLALIYSNVNKNSLKEAMGDYIEEMLPEISKERKDFIKQGQRILNNEAGKEIDLSSFERVDNHPNKK